MLGTVAGDSDKIAVMIDLNTNRLIRLRLGQAHAAWVLQSVDARSVVLQKGPATETLQMQRAGGGAIVNTSSERTDQPAAIPTRTRPLKPSLEDPEGPGVDMR